MRDSRSVLMYINTLGHGGAERVMSQLAGMLAERGWDVTLVTSFRVDDEYELSGLVRRESLEGEQIIQGRIARNVSRIRKLRGLIKARRPDVVLSFMAEPNFRALVASAGLPCACVVSVRNEPAREYGGLLGALVGKLLMPALADGCVLQTREAGEWFPRRLRDKSVVIPNVVDAAFFEASLMGAGEYWVAVGRLVPQKNYPLMLRAFRRVLDEAPGERLRIYGEGPELEGLRMLAIDLGIGGSVSFCGVTDDVAGALAHAKGFVMTSDYEGVPNALMEAMAVGLPCLATDCPCGGPRELFGDEGVTCLVLVGEERSFASLWTQCATNGDMRAHIGSQMKCAAQRFKPQFVFANWNGYLERFVGYSDV